MLSEATLNIPIYVLMLLSPWYLIRIAQTSWKRWIKMGIILTWVMLYTLFAFIGISTPHPVLQARILITTWLMFTFFLTLVSAFYSWPKIENECTITLE